MGSPSSGPVSADMPLSGESKWEELNPPEAPMQPGSRADLICQEEKEEGDTVPEYGM